MKRLFAGIYFNNQLSGETKICDPYPERTETDEDNH